MIFHDNINNRLVCLKQEANTVFWDKHWQTNNLHNVIKTPPKNRFITKTTRKYLQSNSKILEAGCGMGDKVYSLQEAGFDAYGVDTAQNTVREICKLRPQIKIKVADVRKLPFEDGYFDGCWSLGVIEHFWDGYDHVFREMKRVIRGNGYLFLTFPQISFLRHIKIRRNKYLNFDPTELDLNTFYQFIFDSEKVKKDLKWYGFMPVYECGQGGLKGLKDEIKLLRPFLQKIYDGQSLFTKSLHMGLNIVLSKWTGHTKFIVFRKST